MTRGTAVAAALVLLGAASSASALTIHGGPTYAGSGGVSGSCNVSGNACATAGATVTCTGLNPSSFQNLYYGIRNDGLSNGLKQLGNAGPVAGTDQFTTGTGSITYTGTTTVFDDGSTPVNSKLVLTVTAGSTTTVATGGTPAGNTRGDIDFLFKVTSTNLTLNVKVQAALSPGAPSAGSCPAVFDPSRTRDVLDRDISRVDLGFYFQSVPTVTPTSTRTLTPTITETPEDTPTVGPTFTITETPAPTETPTITETPAPTETPTITSTSTVTPTETETPLPTETATVTPTETETPLPTATPTLIGGCSSGIVIDKPKLIVSRNLLPSGDERLTIIGEAVMPGAVDPVADGLGFRVDDSGGVPVFSRTIPAGIWSVNAPHTRWKYIDKSGTVTPGIFKAVVVDKSKKTPGLHRFIIKGRNGSFRVPPGSEPAIVHVTLGSDPGECASIVFNVDGGPRPACRLSGNQNRLVCR